MRNNRINIVLISSLAIVSMVFYLFFNLGNSWEFALYYRGMKLAAILVVSCSVAYSTVSFQTLTTNRILTPSIMGFESVFMLLQTLLVFIYVSESFKVVNNLENFLLSIICMIGFAFLLYMLIYRKGGSNMYLLLLIGLVLGILLNTLSSFLQLLIDPNNFFIVQGKMFASFSNINQDLLGYALLILGITVLLSFRYIKRLDILALGREQAINLGLNYNKNIRLFLVVIAVLVSVSTALAGPVLFLGLLVSNLTYEILNTYKHEIIIPVCALVTAVVLVGGQFLTEYIFELSTPISTIINFIGGVYFVYLLIRRKKL